MPEEIESAVKRVSSSNISSTKIPGTEASEKTTIQSQETTDPSAINIKKEQKKVGTPLPIQQKKKGTSKKLVIILVVVSLLILIGAAILGFFWDRIF